MKKQYVTEREGQFDFFENFKIDYQNNEVLIDNTDGVWNGNLLEFKLNIENLNKVLYQAVKYLSHMRLKGESVPANILLISLNTTTVYVYHSQDYFKEIHTIYTGAASKDNEGFVANRYISKYDYSNMADAISVQNLLREQKYMPIRLDEDCIVGWAERYYRENETATKGDFLGDETGQVRIIGEIREPKYFKGLILPYEGKTNEKFKYLMDKLNDRMKKKDLGAFYTPIAYCKKAAELVRMAIARVPVGNDYIILDRCAGTGNLESVLSDEELSHCILSTYEYYEYKVLVERLGDKVRAIIPPTEANVVYANGCVKNADAMSKEYIDNEVIQEYLQNPNCTIILYENPPYRDQSQKNNEKKSENAARTDRNFVREKMAETQKYGLAVNDILNLFVFSAYEYYLRQPTDSYIVFGPVKHWKRVGVSDKHIEKGYVFNRQHFHASQEAITCMYFNNIDETVETVDFEVYDIFNGELKYNTNITVKKSHMVMSKLFDKRKEKEDDYSKAICCNRDGTEAFRSCSLKAYYNENIIGYLRAESYGFDANSVCLVRNGLYNGHGFYLRKDKYLNGLPLFVAKEYPFDDWYYKNMIDTTSDGGDAYTKDAEFLKRCLIYTCLSNQNKCLSFKGSDGREYQNELCFDNKALALMDLQTMSLNDADKELLALWSKILAEAKQTDNYNSHWNYGVYQITRELNTYDEVGTGRSKKNVYHYPELNGDLISLRSKLKDYYKEYITPLMFKYELIK